MLSNTYPRLLGDIGGTHSRFAWQAHAGAAPSDVATYLCARHDTLLQAIQHYLTEHHKPAPHWCALGIANPITGDRVQMTNHHWSFSISGLQRELQLERLVVINDFTALALSLPALSSADLRPIGRGIAEPNGPLALIGPGTGLGVSGLLPTGHGTQVAITGEGGHVSLAAGDSREAAVIERLRLRYGHASAERALSGPGLVNLYEAACVLSGRGVEALGPADVIARARDASDPCCVTALELFCNFLGSVAGDLALTLGARGGVYIGGGVSPRIIPEIERSQFRERFEAKGRFRDYLLDIPTVIINSGVSPAFVGAARALDMALG